MFQLLSAAAYVPMIDVSGVDFLMVLNEIKALIPSVLPVIIGLIAFRKGWSFLQRAIHGA